MHYERTRSRAAEQFFFDDAGPVVPASAHLPTNRASPASPATRPMI